MRNGTVSVLSPEQDALITRIIGCAIRVHKELGPGFLERIYPTALSFELEEEAIPYQREVPLVVNYRDVLPITGQRIDFIVDGSVILDIKAVSRFDPIFEARIISYLRTAKLKVGLLLNFNLLLLRDGIQRIVV